MIAKKILEKMNIGSRAKLIVGAIVAALTISLSMMGVVGAAAYAAKV